MRTKILETTVLATGLVVGALLFGAVGRVAAEEAKPLATPQAKGDIKAYRGAILEFFHTLQVIVDADPDEGTAPLTVHFSAEVQEGFAAEDPKFKWNFGDGSPAVSGENPTHVYTKPGRYRVVATATDATKRRGESKTLRIEVREPEK